MTLIATYIENLYAQNPELDNRLNRGERHGALDAALKSNDDPNSILSANAHAEFQAALGKDYKIPVLNLNGNVVVGTSRPVTITSAENTSRYVTVVPVIQAFGFTMTPESLENNAISYAKDWNNKFLRGVNQIVANMDAAVVAAINANKTQVLEEDLGYTVTSNVVKCAKADEERFLGDLSVIQKSNNFGFGGNMLIGNAGAEALINQLFKYEKYNNKNLFREHSDKSIHITNAIANDGTDRSTFYIVENGSIGLLTRCANEARKGYTTKSGASFASFQMPIIEKEAEYYFYDSVQDASALIGAASAHLTRTPMEYHGFSIEYAIVIADNEDLTTYATPIVAGAVTAA